MIITDFWFLCSNHFNISVATKKKLIPKLLKSRIHLNKRLPDVHDFAFK